MSFFGGGRSQPATPSMQTQYVREAPGIEERKIELMDIAREIAQQPIDLPDIQVAGLGALEKQALEKAAMTGVGADTVQAGIDAVNRANIPIGSEQIGQFLNPYQQFVTDEINRQSQMQQNEIANQAIQSGAFGGGREGVQRAELQGRTLNTIGRSLASGFNTALGAAQRQQMLGLQGGQLLGQLGLGQQRMAQADINQLMQGGGLQRQLAQAALDAQRQSELQQKFEPFQRAEFLANLYKSGPTSRSAVTAATAPTTSPLAQAVGTGIGAFTAYQGLNPNTTA
jgi:hypothetical protein|tara:strand:+ start:481 stop:1332 length:852 start_codon:yes stop_codon:yes gene_type:complete